METSDGPPVDLVNAVLRDAGLGRDGRPVTADDLESMSGGVDASTYLVHAPDADVVVKLHGTGLHAEARALRAWGRHTGRVPEVLGEGTVPAPRDGDDPVRYLVLEVMQDDRGGVVETAAKYLEGSPSSARELGEALGAELHRLHQAVDTAFGNFGDAPGAGRRYDLWGAYLSDFLTLHDGFLKDLGISEGRLRGTHDAMRGGRFVAEARFLHGDVSIRNVAVYGCDPLDVGLFDPNPLSGDPSWDLAPLANNVAFDERRRRRGGEPAELDLDAEVWSGVQGGYPDEVSEEAMLTAQVVQAVLQAEHRHARRRDGDAGDPEVEATEDFIRDAIDRLTR